MKKEIGDSTVAIAGIGGVGSHIAEMLARENVDLRIIDMGRVEEEDMHRLALFQEEDITKFKVKQAKVRLSAINPKNQVKSFHEEIISSNVFLLEGDVIVDATNNDEVNAMTIAHAVKKKLPLVLVRVSGGTAVIAVVQKSVAKLQEKIRLKPQNVLSSTSAAAAGFATAEIIKIISGEKTSKMITIDLSGNKLKVTKL